LKPEPRRLASQIGRSHRGVAWHGPSVLEALEGVDAARASARPRPDLHTIWELVLHVTAWQRMARETLEGGTYRSMTGEEDWPPVPESPTETLWEQAKSEMALVNEQLVEAVRKFPEERIEDLVPGREFNYYFLLHGVAQHNIYHAGQIAIAQRL
jgi:uncharacterized damage-inducible protein DinB